MESLRSVERTSRGHSKSLVSPGQGNYRQVAVFHFAQVSTPRAERTPQSLRGKKHLEGKKEEEELLAGDNFQRLQNGGATIEGRGQKERSKSCVSTGRRSHHRGNKGKSGRNMGSKRAIP